MEEHVTLNHQLLRKRASDNPPACAPGIPRPRTTARSRPAPLGDAYHRGPATRQVCPLLQDSSRPDRRGWRHADAQHAVLHLPA